MNHLKTLILIFICCFSLSVYSQYDTLKVDVTKTKFSYRKWKKIVNVDLHKSYSLSYFPEEDSLEDLLIGNKDTLYVELYKKEILRSEFLMSPRCKAYGVVKMYDSKGRIKEVREQYDYSYITSNNLRCFMGDGTHAFWWEYYKKGKPFEKLEIKTEFDDKGNFCERYFEYKFQDGKWVLESNNVRCIDEY